MWPGNGCLELEPPLQEEDGVGGVERRLIGLATLDSGRST